MKTALKLTFSLSIFFFTLAVVELFFRLNKEFIFFQSKEFIYLKVYDIPELIAPNAPMTPSYIVDYLKKKYLKFEIANYASSKILEYQYRNNYRTTTPIGPPMLISMKNLSYQAPFIIIDKSFNPIFNIQIYEAEYKFDQSRRRIVEKQIISQNKKNILLIGCSYVFGTGVNEGEDLASLLSEKLPNYNIYNLGIPGGA